MIGLPFLDVLAPIVGKVLDRVLPDTEARDEAKRQFTLAMVENNKELSEAAASIIRAEAQSEHVLTATWRPILMLTITAILANNFLIAPYLGAMFGASVTLPMPDQLWTLLTVGVGGYVVGRTGEKIAGKVADFRKAAP